MSRIPSVRLNNGLGTWSGWTAEEHEAAQPWIVSALKNGYRHLDTAHMYGTEHAVGEAIRVSGIPREEIFVSTKLPSHHHGRVEYSLDESLGRFGFDYFDLYLVHWPASFAWSDHDPDLLNPEVVEHPNINETWASMEQLLSTGKVKAIGVSNFSVKTLTQLLETAKIVPAVNQVEMHLHLNQNDLKAFTDSKGITLTAYFSTGYEPVRDNPAVVQVAKKHGVSSTQVSLAWHVARGTAAIAKSTNVKHQVQNINLPCLDEMDVQTLNSLNRNTRLTHAHYGAPSTDPIMGWTYDQLGW